MISQKIYSLPRCRLRSWTQKKYKRNRENFYWVLHFSYLHKDTLTLFRLTIIDGLPFNSLQVPEFDFLFRMRQDSNLRWTCVNRLTVYCLRPLGNAYIFYFKRFLTSSIKDFGLLKISCQDFLNSFQPSSLRSLSFSISLFFCSWNLSCCSPSISIQSFPSADFAPPQIYGLIPQGFIPFLKGAIRYPRKL